MDSSICVISVSEGNSCELYVNSHGCEASYVETKQYALGDTKEAVIVKSEALDLVTISDNGNVTVPSIGADADRSHHVAEYGEQISLPSSCCEQKDADICNEIDLCQGFHQSLSFDPKVQRSFNKSATFPSSREPCSVSLISSIQEKHCPSETSAYARSISLPTSLKLVSALKGGRAQSGTSPKADMHVKWAPEVYDPPCTSMSHTVNNHRQRPKAKKKDNRKIKNKNKNNGKPTRGSGGGERKNTNHKYTIKIPDPSDTGLHSSVPKVLLNGYDKSAVVGQEAKCASSFPRAVLPSMHFPLGEAS
ncbi:uncharacterized protein M6B38_106035 [Iris pallida]|uniref:Uncharacterized protein n=1 Tax=Iris pallida TaxID=29817 RepID=A0AAX6ESG3_IRIPA|nr:uncharacterized protein M6B38_106035 [Iris pallida]